MMDFLVILSKMSAFGSYFETLLRDRGYTVRSFGSAVKTSKTSISAIILGKRTPPFEAMPVWCDTLKLVGDERERFCTYAAIAHLPNSVQDKFVQMFKDYTELNYNYQILLIELKKINRAADGP